jgi:hypothetical protein
MREAKEIVDASDRSRDRATSRDMSGSHDSGSKYTVMTEHRCRIGRSARHQQVGSGGRVRAQSVRYVPDRDAIEIVTARDAGFLIPRQGIGALQEVPTDDLAKLEVLPDGSASNAKIGASNSAYTG